MDLSDLTFVRDKLIAMPRHGWEEVAAKSGVPRSTLEKIAYGVTKNPSYVTVARLSGTLRRGNGNAARA